MLALRLSILLVCLLLVTEVHSKAEQNPELLWDILDSAGGLMCSGSYSLGGSLGQTAPGISVGATRIVSGGYWAGIDTLPPCVAYACGDANGDGRVTVADATYIVSYIYRDGPAPIGQGDVNLDGRLTVADATYIVSYIYRGGHPPCEPPVTSPAEQKKRAERGVLPIDPTLSGRLLWRCRVEWEDRVGVSTPPKRHETCTARCG